MTDGAQTHGTPPASPRLILASASPARLETLRRAGLSPEVIVSGVDEDALTASDTAGLTLLLARAKASAVAATVVPDRPTLVVGCDSLLDFDGRPRGKPADAAAAQEQWRAMRGRRGTLHTGHSVHLLRPGHAPREVADTAATTVHFAELSDAEIEAYVATGEPLQVAGSFTIDGLGGPFVERVEGDPHSVVGISLPLLRRLLSTLGIAWPSLWR